MRPRRELARWELDLHARCARFVAELAPSLTPEVQAHVTQRVFVGMHRTLRHCVVLPSEVPQESSGK